MRKHWIGAVCVACVWFWVGTLVAQKKPPVKPAAVVEPCAPTQVQQWPQAADPSLDWTRAINNLHSRLDQLEKKIDARPLYVHDPETEDLHRRLLGKPSPVYEGTISGKTIVLTPRAGSPGRQP